MKTRISLLLTVSIFCFLGCSENSKTSDTATAESIEAPITTSAPLTTDLTGTEGTDANVTVNSNDAATGTPTGTVAINPPHGQPGHDCAIAVGAPLTGKGTPAQAAPQLNATPQTSTAPMGAPTLSVPAVTNTAPGLNPPHGQPGHDCAIAVGAPLKK